MMLKAPACRSYAIRIVICLLMVLSFGGWYAYDGTIGYPSSVERLIDHSRKDENTRGRMEIKLTKLSPAHKAIWVSFTNWNQTDPEARQLLDEMFHDEEGWHSDLDIKVQKILAGVLGLIALGVGYWLYSYNHKHVALDETALVVPGSGRVELASVTGIDDMRWEKDQLFEVHYTAGATAKTLRLDSFDWDQLNPIREALLQTKGRIAVAVPEAEAPTSPANSESVAE